MERFIELDDPFETAYLAARGFRYELERTAGFKYGFTFQVSPELEQTRKEFAEDELFQKFIRCRKKLGHKMWGGSKQQHEF